MRRRLLVSYLSLAVVVLLALEIPLAVIEARREHGLVAAQAQRDAVALGVLAQQGIEHPDTNTLSGLADRYRASTGAEISIVDAAGATVVHLAPGEGAEADEDVRPEIQAALAGRSVTSSNRDEGRPTVTAAVPIQVGGRVVGAVVVSVPGAGALHRIHVLWAELAVLAAVVLAVTALVGLRMARSVTGPLAVLEEASSRLGRGELSARASAAGPPEVQALAVAFNEMAARLEELVAAQRRFVADASHQLRSPLTALRLRLENLQSSVGGPAVAGLEAASDEASRLSRIVDGLLALTRAEGARTQRQVVDVAAVVAERCEAWSALADERGVHVAADVDGADGSRALAVPGYLDQMLDNLLANALDATPAGRGITLTLERRPGHVSVHVRDQGPGMTAEERARAFDRFWRGSAAPAV